MSSKDNEIVIRNLLKTQKKYPTLNKDELFVLSTYKSRPLKVCLGPDENHKIVNYGEYEKLLITPDLYNETTVTAWNETTFLLNKNPRNLLQYYFNKKNPKYPLLEIIFLPFKDCVEAVKNMTVDSKDLVYFQHLNLDTDIIYGFEVNSFLKIIFSTSLETQTSHYSIYLALCLRIFASMYFITKYQSKLT